MPCRPCYTKFNWLSLWKPALRAGLMFGCGDIFVQNYLQGRRILKIQKKRTATYFLMGTLVGVALPVVKRFEDIYVTGKYAKGGRILVDQLLFVPILLLYFLIAGGLIERKGVSYTKEYLDKHYFHLLKASYLFWPAFSVFTFYAVKTRFQYYTIDFGFICYSAYLSWYFNKCECGCIAHKTK